MIKQRKEKKINPFLPVMGLVMAVCMGAIAYFLAPEVIKLLRDSGIMTPGEFNARFDIQSDEEIIGSTIHYAFAVLLWFIVFGTTMTLFALAIGEDPNKEMELVQPRDGNIKKLKKYARALEKQQKKRAKQIREKQLRDARAAKKK
ncbi:MAG: hypothetical protein HC915_13465 [Anaerolineae bacterium]|nr:hypothetical protein [Anaerolineae bacterium]